LSRIALQTRGDSTAAADRPDYKSGLAVLQIGVSRVFSENGDRHHREFISQLFVDDEPFTVGNGFTKKKAEQSASEKDCGELALR